MLTDGRIKEARTNRKECESAHHPKIRTKIFVERIIVLFLLKTKRTVKADLIDSSTLLIKDSCM